MDLTLTKHPRSAFMKKTLAELQNLLSVAKATVAGLSAAASDASVDANRARIDGDLGATNTNIARHKEILEQIKTVKHNITQINAAIRLKKSGGARRTAPPKEEPKPNPDIGKPDTPAPGGGLLGSLPLTPRQARIGLGTVLGIVASALLLRFTG